MLDYLIYFLIIVGFIAFLALAVGKIHVWIWGNDE